MNKQLTSLLNDIGNQFIVNDIDKYVSYCKINENLKHTTHISTTHFDSSLDEALLHVSNNIQFKYIGYLEDC